jgi:hypothetical protein
MAGLGESVFDPLPHDSHSLMEGCRIVADCMAHVADKVA